MKAPSGFGNWVLALSFCLCAAVRAAEPDEKDRRIAVLEDRVKRLEELVQTLAAARPDPVPAPAEPAIVAERQSPVSAPSTAVALERFRLKPLPQELLPNLGQIGAVANFYVGGHSGPYSLSKGSYFGGSIDLPLRLVRGGRLSYEISAGLARSSTQLPLTSNVAQVANLAALGILQPGAPANLLQALSGTGAAPFPVRVDADWRLQLLQVVPFALKYTSTRWDRYRLRPYAMAGAATYVTISNQVNRVGVRSDAAVSPELQQLFQSAFGGNAPFAGPLVAGQIAPSPELSSRRIPAGQGGIDLGLQTGGGVEWRFSNGISIGLDARYNYLGNGVSYSTFSTKTGWHF